MDKKIQLVRVELGLRSYSIYLGYDILAECLAAMAEIPLEKEVFIVSDSNVAVLYGPRLEKMLKQQGYHPAGFVVPAGEGSKSWAQAEAILTKMLESNLGRNTAVIALGGGVVGDLTGFVAALYRRGVPLFQIPTTLLAQVDSSVGGKVAVNHSLGKNMLGTFYQPRAVWADLDTLETLPQPEWAAGLAEVCKYAVIWDQEFFAFLEQHACQIKERNVGVIPEMIARCCSIKAEIVGRDERDEGLRNLLNFGHTFGHALEGATAFKKYRHGEAVAIGMTGALSLAQNLDLIDAEVAERVKNLLIEWELPVSFPAGLLNEVLVHLNHDKKITGKQLFFVLPDSLGHAVMKSGFNEELLRQSLIKLTNN